MQKEALVVSSRTGNSWRLASDEGAYLMGDDVAPCPLSFMTSGMVASFTNHILALARTRRLRIRDLRLVQDNFYTMSGSILRGTMTGGALPVQLTVEIDCDAAQPELLELVRQAVAASPASGLMSAELTNIFTLTHNGRQIDTGRVSALERPAEPDAGGSFDLSKPAEGDWTGLIVRNGMTPRAEGSASAPGSSLAEEQSRTLHLRGICTLGAGGLKKIEQQLYSPHGSIFHFLSDEAVGAGGEGRAPDAATYLSAGIAFCFMTQFGRYAKFVKKEVKDYRIIQDTHFLPGAAGPVETHVYLVTDHDDMFARTILDMSEQTCFLHALCRTRVHTNVDVKVV
jgi:uncharacterized OsmC-like protein